MSKRKERKETSKQVWALVTELEGLRNQFSEQSCDLVPDYRSEICRGSSWFERLAYIGVYPYCHWDTDNDTARWLKSQQLEWQNHLKLEQRNLAEKSDFYLRYKSLTTRIEVLGGEIRVDYYDSEEDFGKQFCVYCELPQEHKHGTEAAVYWFNSYDYYFLLEKVVKLENLLATRREVEKP